MSIGCAIKRPLYKGLNSGKSLISLKKKNIYLKPFSRNRIKQEWLYGLGSVEATFRDEFMKLFNKPGIFDESSENGLGVTAELIYWEQTNAVDSNMKTTVLYEFKLDNGTTLLSEKITTEGQEGPIWAITGPFRQVRATEKSLMQNLEKLYSAMNDKLPAKYQAYLNNNKSNIVLSSSKPSKTPVAVPDKGINKNKAGKLDFGTYYALVVGNNKYRYFPHLKTAVSDAKAMSQLLKSKYNYRVKLLIDATRSDILKSIAQYRRVLTKGDNLLIYYAGHGWLDKEADEGYWFPIDAEKDVQTNWISNGFITNSLKAIPAKHVLVVADSCYSGKLARGISIVLRNNNYYKRLASHDRLCEYQNTLVIDLNSKPPDDEFYQIQRSRPECPHFWTIYQLVQKQIQNDFLFHLYPSLVPIHQMQALSLIYD